MFHVKHKRILKEWVEVVLILFSCVNSIISVGSVEADNYILVIPCMIVNLMILLILCKYGRGE